MWIIDLIQSALVAEDNDYRKVLGDVAIACRNNGFFREPNWHKILNSTFKCIQKTQKTDDNLKSSDFSVICTESRIKDDDQTKYIDDDRTIFGKDDQREIGVNNPPEIRDNDQGEIAGDVQNEKGIEDEENGNNDDTVDDFQTGNENVDLGETKPFGKSKSLKRNRSNSPLDLDFCDEILFTPNQIDASTPMKSSPKKHKPNEIINFDCKKKNCELQDLKRAKWSQLCDEFNEKKSNVKFLTIFDQCKELRIVLNKEIFRESAENGIDITNLRNSSVVDNINKNISLKNSSTIASKGRKSVKNKKTEKYKIREYV